MEDDEYDFDRDEERRVPKWDEIDWSALRSALTSLQNDGLRRLSLAAG